MKKRVAGLVAMSIALTPVSLRPAAAAAGSVHAQFDLGSPQRGPFPSNRFTVADSTQNTGLRVNLPSRLRRAPVGLLRHRCPERARRVQS